MDALLGEPWMLSPSVALRPEPFGALAYHFGNRKLTFLKRPELVAVPPPTSARRSSRPASRPPSTRPSLPPCSAWPRPT